MRALPRPRAKAGVASVVADDEDAALAKVRTLLTMLPQNNLASLPLFDFTDSTEPLDPAGCPKLIVKAVADADSLVELHAEYGKGIYTFLGTMAGATTAFVTTSKENALDSDACDKAARFVKICDAYNIPIVTFIDSKGFALDANVAVVKDAAKLGRRLCRSNRAEDQRDCRAGRLVLLISRLAPKMRMPT